MNVSRRDAVVAGLWTLGVSGLVLAGAASAQTADEAAVAESVDVLRKGILRSSRAC